MRKPIVINKYNLTFSDVKKLKIGDRSKIIKPLFWRNNVVNAWCISGTTIKNNNDSRYGTYNEFWIGIYDEELVSQGDNLKVQRKTKLAVNCHAYGGMTDYNFKEFFNPKEIENDMDLEMQEKLLNTINNLIDEGILIIPK